MIACLNLLLDFEGEGTLNVKNGIELESVLGQVGGKGSDGGTVNLEGAGTNWENTSLLSVGYFTGRGVINIKDGASVTGEEAAICDWGASEGIANVDGPDSRMIISGQLRVGSGQQGTLNITNGGTVKSKLSEIGTFFASDGVVNIDGERSTWTSSKFIAIGGQEGTAAIFVTNGGKLIAEDELLLRDT